MKIEAGKKYQARDGQVAEVNKVRPLEADGSEASNFPVQGKLSGSPQVWTRDGRYFSHPELPNDKDLVAEISEEGETVTFDVAPPPGPVNVGGRYSADRKAEENLERGFRLNASIAALVANQPADTAAIREISATMLRLRHKMSPAEQASVVAWFSARYGA